MSYAYTKKGFSQFGTLYLRISHYYHGVSRCVRRAYLCVVDQYSDQSYEHRRDWVESRLLELAGVFAIDVCAYAVIGNHLHVVLCIDKEQVLAWTNMEVLVQWHKLFKGTLLTQSLVKGIFLISMN
ncbi:Transposase IS200-like domain-containing protein [Shewanella violacea]